MNIRDLALLSLLSAGGLAAQNPATRPTVAVHISAPTGTAADSSSAVAAFRRGLQTDSLVVFLERSVPTPTPDRGAQFLVSALLRRTGDVVALNTRTFNVATSAITVRMSTAATTATLGDSAAAMGRRIAQALAAARP